MKNDDGNRILLSRREGHQQFVRLAIHLSRNMGKHPRKMKVYNEVFCVTFFVFRAPFFAFHSILWQGQQSREKSKDFIVYFFAALIKPPTHYLQTTAKNERNWYETRIVCRVFAKFFILRSALFLLDVAISERTRRQFLIALNKIRMLLHIFAKTAVDDV